MVDKCLENSGHLQNVQSIGRKLPWLSRPGERQCGIPRLNATRPRQHPTHRFTATVRNPIRLYVPTGPRSPSTESFTRRDRHPNDIHIRLNIDGLLSFIQKNFKVKWRRHSPENLPWIHISPRALARIERLEKPPGDDRHRGESPEVLRCECGESASGLSVFDSVFFAEPPHDFLYSGAAEDNLHEVIQQRIGNMTSR